MKKCENTNDYYEMTIVDNHREYNMPTHPNVRIRACWEGYDVLSNLETKRNTGIVKPV